MSLPAPSPTSPFESLGVAELAERAEAVLAEVARAFVGKAEVARLVLTGFLANGHVLLEDFPGLGKTLLARSFAQVLGLGFSRAQFTPDLMPADITGSSVFDQRTASFSFQPGPVFTNLLLADEINRASPRTQAALLEAMQERQVTVDGVTRQLASPFLVIATQNPIELEGTYPLPEAQLDRFILRTSVGYPGAGAETEVLTRRLQRRSDDIALAPVVGREELLAMQYALEDVHVSQAIGQYIVALVGATRARPTVEIGASPRGSLAVMLLARAWAALAGRDFVVPEDVKAVAVPALAHRLRLRPEMWVRGERPEGVVIACLGEVPVPSAEEAGPSEASVPGPGAGVPAPSTSGN
ncbi:MAG: AAA family ATPase [Acidimicrobiales bacterium]